MLLKLIKITALGAITLNLAACADGFYSSDFYSYPDDTVVTRTSRVYYDDAYPVYHRNRIHSGPSSARPSRVVVSGGGSGRIHPGPSSARPSTVVVNGGGSGGRIHPGPSTPQAPAASPRIHAGSSDIANRVSKIIG